MRRLTFALALGLIVGVGCATTPESDERAVDVAGDWTGTWFAAAGSGNASFTLSQDGRNVTGTLTLPGFPGDVSVIVTGVVTGAHLYGSAFLGGRDALFDAEVDGDTMAGAVRGRQLITLRLWRRPPLPPR